MMARIIWPESKGKNVRQVGALFYESTLLEMWDKLSHISEERPTTEIPDKLSGIIRRMRFNFLPSWREVTERR